MLLNAMFFKLLCIFNIFWGEKNVISLDLDKVLDINTKYVGNCFLLVGDGIVNECLLLLILY